MSKSSEAVKRWRVSSKKRVVESMGGKCQCCGYDKTDSALELHHINPEEKELSFGAIRANPKSWDKIVEELRKCILLCANCHREVHDGTTELPEKFESFNEEFVDYKSKKMFKKDYVDECPVCHGQKSPEQITCSLKCAGLRGSKVDWEKVDLENLLNNNSYTAIGRMLNCSDNAVRRRAKKIGII